VYYAEQREVELADVVVSPSSYMLRYVQRRGWSLPPATYVIKVRCLLLFLIGVVIIVIARARAQNVISQRFLEEASRRQADQALRVLVFFGRLEPRKGVELLLDALERLARRNATGTLHTVAFLGADLRTPEHGSMLRYIRDRHRTAGWSHLQIEFRRFKRNEVPLSVCARRPAGPPFTSPSRSRTGCGVRTSWSSFRPSTRTPPTPSSRA
jgi:glycosyltransferase involved in cell wall biosynthesis